MNVEIPAMARRYVIFLMEHPNGHNNGDVARHIYSIYVRCCGSCLCIAF